MISRMEGELVGVSPSRVEVKCGEITYELMVPATDEQRLESQIGQNVGFHTLQYLESQGQGASFVPRLIGFSTQEARQFFELFTTVKGLGARKALRALQLPFHSVARAIAAKDLGLLVSLPEIGKRTAETIIAELHGKVDRFIELKPLGEEDMNSDSKGHYGLINDAAAILTQLGESGLQARQLVERALQADPEIDTVDGLVTAALRLRELI